MPEQPSQPRTADATVPVARNLRFWRKTRKLSVSGLAREAGVAKSTVSLVERGRGNPSVQTLAALAAALAIPLASLFQEAAPAASATSDVYVVAMDDQGEAPDNVLP